MYRVFTASGSYTPTTGAVRALAFATGGGGAGGSWSGSACSYSTGACSGWTAMAFLNLAGLAAQAVTIGAGGIPIAASSPSQAQAGSGGLTSLGALCAAPGGPGGFCNQGSNNYTYLSDPRGTASGSVGLLIMPPGLPSPPIDFGYGYNSVGGASFWGGGAGIGGGHNGSVQLPFSSIGYGQGGGAGGSNQQGTPGSSGVVVVLEF